MRKFESNFFEWALSSACLMAVVFSIILMVPKTSKAAEITINCKGGGTVTCTGPVGSSCSGSDYVACACSSGGTSKSCPGSEEEPPLIANVPIDERVDGVGDAK